MHETPKDSGMNPALAGPPAAPASSAPDSTVELLATVRTLINQLVAMRPVWEAIAAGLCRPKELQPVSGGTLATPTRPPTTAAPTARPAPRAPGAPVHAAAAAQVPQRPRFAPARAPAPAAPRGRRPARSGADLTPAQQMGMIRDGLAMFPYLPEFTSIPFDTLNTCAGFTRHIKNESSPHIGKTWAQLTKDVSGKALLWWRVRRQVKDETGGELFPGPQAHDGSYPALAWDQWQQKFADEAVTALWALAHADDITADAAGAFTTDATDEEPPPE